MEALALYLLKSSALMALFYAAYHFLLRKETFFKSNRWYLLLGLVTSVMLPLVTYKKVVWIEPLPQQFDWSVAGPIVIAPAEPQGFEIDWMLVMAVIYLLGITSFLMHFFMDFYSLRKALKGKTMFQQADFRFVDTDENVAPFSYFNYIVYNSSLYSDAELANIIEHEKVHSNQNHTMDVLFARTFCIVFWFNPFVWLYKKAMLQNLEFIADSEATKNIEDKKSYQITLLKVTAHENCVDITNHFYQSLIKKRIVMLNKNQSKKSNSWKYFLIIPALIAFMIYFQVKVVAQEKAPGLETLLQKGAEVVVDKNSSDADLKREAERVKKEHGVTLKFSKVKRNSQGEITCIKATYKDQNGKKGTTQVSGDEPIQPFRFYKNDNGKIGFGNGRGREVRVVGVGANGFAGFGDDFSISLGDDDLNIEIPEIPEIPELPEIPEAPEAAIYADTLVWSTGKNHALVMPNGKSIVIKDKNGKKTVIKDGKVVPEADVEKVLSEMGPIIVNGEDVLKKGGVYTYSYSGNGDNQAYYYIDTEKISKEAMEKARAAMDKARPKMDKMRAEMDAQRKVMDKARPKMDKMRAEMDVQRAEMDKARIEMDKAREQMKKEMAEIKKQQAEMKAELEKERAKSKK